MKSDDFATVANSKFPNVDITHRPRRLQRDNLLQAGTALQDDTDSPEHPSNMSRAPLHHVTIERAIQYYETNATGDLATLYSSTAKWLRNLLSYGMNAVNKALQEVAKESEERTNEIQEDNQS